MDEDRRSGTVKWFSRVKGYGFIAPDDEENEIFVHFTGIEGEGYRNLEKGQRVSFVVEDTEKGPQAVAVRDQGFEATSWTAEPDDEPMGMDESPMGMSSVDSGDDDKGDDHEAEDDDEGDDYEAEAEDEGDDYEDELEDEGDDYEDELEDEGDAFADEAEDEGDDFEDQDDDEGDDFEDQDDDEPPDLVA